MDVSTLKLWVILTMFICTMVTIIILILGIPCVLSNRSEEYATLYTVGSVMVTLTILFIGTASTHIVCWND